MRLVWAAWAWLVVGNAAALVFTIGTAKTHLVFLTDMSLQIGLSQLGANTLRFFVPVVVGSIITSIIHVCTLAYSLTPIRRRVAAVITHLLGRSRAGHTQSMAVLSVVSASRSLHSVSERLTSNKTLVVSAWTRYQAEITRLCMLWEVTLQTFQAYKISYLVASVSINRLIALVVVTNCWFSPLLHYAMGSRPKAYVQLGRRLVDSSLDVVYNMVIPLSILYPYYRDMDGSLSLYPVVFYYDDVWYVNAVSELRQVFVTSWPDFVSKVSGCLSLVYRFYRVRTSIDNVRTATRVSAGPNGSAVRSARADNWHRSRLVRLLDLVLVLWGAAVFSLHVAASITSLRFHDPDCLLEMQPWGSLSYSCASLEISCLKRGIEGDRETMGAILDTVDPLSVQNLILSNCGQLHVPREIQKLQYLSMIKIYNSTIVSWDAEAAVRQVYHPQLQVIFLARVNMSELPNGLLAHDFPRSVWDIELCITNLSTDPDAVASPWANVGIVALEGSPELTEFPAVLASLPSIFTINVGMNGITVIPDSVLEGKHLIGFGMAGNPIDRLPNSVGYTDQLQYLNFVATTITEIPPAWMTGTATGAAVLSAAGSPLCEVQHVATPHWLSLDCEMPPSSLYGYPINAEDAWRHANS